MAKRQVFYSFHYGNDVRRVAQIRNIGAIEDNKPVSENEWEEVKKKSDVGIKKWIDDNMKNRSCLVVLVGEETANRKWIKYEIKKAYKLGKGIVGIYVHNIKDPLLVKKGESGKSDKGENPFKQFSIEDGTNLSKYVECYNPSSNDAYNDIANNLEDLIENAIKNAGTY